MCKDKLLWSKEKGWFRFFIKLFFTDFACMYMCASVKICVCKSVCGNFPRKTEIEWLKRKWIFQLFSCMKHENIWKKYFAARKMVEKSHSAFNEMSQIQYKKKKWERKIKIAIVFHILVFFLNNKHKPHSSYEKRITIKWNWEKIDDFNWLINISISQIKMYISCNCRYRKLSFQD